MTYSSRHFLSRGTGPLLQALSGIVVVAFLACVPGKAMASGRTTGAALPAWKTALNRLRAQTGPVTLVMDTKWKRPIWIGNMRLPAQGTGPAQRASHFLRTYGSILGLDPTLLGQSRVLNWSEGQVVRFSLTHQGLPLWGLSLVVRVQGRNIMAAGGRLPNILNFDPPRPVRSAARVAREIRLATGHPARVLGLGYVPMAGQGVLAWRLEQRFTGRPGILLLTVEDATGRILFARSGLLHAEGYVYDPNPVVAGQYEEVTLENMTNTSVLEGTYAAAYQCGPNSSDYGCPNWAHGATADSDGNFLYEPVEGSMSDNFAEVQGYYHADKFNRWLEDRFGFQWSCAGSRTMKVFVNWNGDNAFYADSDGDPQGCGDITFGEGSVDYVYDADVLYHEFTHGMVEHTCNLGCPDMGVCIDGQGINVVPYSLNEGTADYFSMAYTNDPNLGEYAGQNAQGEPYIRTALNDQQCPWDQTGESHYDGQIWMGGLWEIRTALGSELGDDLAYGAVISLPTDADYDMAAQILMQTAQEMLSAGRLTQQQVAQVQGIIGPQGRGMVGCHRIVPLDHRPADKQDIYAFGIIPTYDGYIDEIPVGLQWSMDVPADGRRLHFGLSDYMGTSWRVFVSAGRPVGVDFGRNAIVYNGDYEFDGSPTDLYIDSSSNPPLQQNTTYYFLIAYSDAPYGSMWQLWGDVTTGPEPFPEPVIDAGPVTDASHRDSRIHDAEVRDSRPSTSDGSAEMDASTTTIPESLTPRQGCGCSTQTRSNGPLALVTAFLLLFVLARGKRPWKH